MKLIDAVKQLKDEYPNAVYYRDPDYPYGGVGDCSYADGRIKGGPPSCGCLIGQGLRLCGVPDDVLVHLDSMEIVSANEFGAMLHRETGVDVTDEEGVFLESVQVHQDAGKTWGDSWNEATKQTEKTMARD